MNSRAAELRERRTRLQQDAAAQRELLGSQIEDIQSRVQATRDGLFNAGAWLRQPWLLSGAAALLAIVRPGRALGFLGKTLLLVSTVRRLLPLLGLLRQLR